MKKTKRMLALLLALLMALALCACGGTSEAPPANTEEPAPAEEESGVGKYTMQYLELSPSYMDSMFAEYGVTAKQSVGSRKLIPEDMEDWYIELKDDGSGYLYWGEDNQGKIDTWKLDGETLYFKAGSSGIDGSIKQGLMHVGIDDGYDMFFAKAGAKLPAVELISMEDYVNMLYADEEEAEPAVQEEKAEPAVQEEKAAPAPEKEKDSSGVKKKSDKPAAGTQGITVEPGLLFEGDGLRVTATGECLDDPAHGPRIGIRVENDTDVSYLMSCTPAFINGWAASAYVEVKSIDEAGFTTVKAHSTLDCYLCTELKDVKPFGVKEVARLDCEIKFIDESDWFADHPSSGIFTVLTSLADSYSEPAVPKGKVLYKAEGVRIIGLNQSAENDDSGMRTVAMLYVENNSSMNVALVAIKTYVNDEKITGLASLELLPGTKGVMPIYIMDSSLKEAGIEEIDSVECEFWVQFKDDDDNMDHMTETDLLSIPVA